LVNGKRFANLLRPEARVCQSQPPRFLESLGGLNVGDGIGREGTVELRTRKAKSFDAPWNQEVQARLEAKKALAQLSLAGKSRISQKVRLAVERCLAVGCDEAEIQTVWREAGNQRAEASPRIEWERMKGEPQDDRQ
jgi:hypothetical protein